MNPVRHFSILLLLIGLTAHAQTDDSSCEVDLAIARAIQKFENQKNSAGTSPAATTPSPESPAPAAVAMPELAPPRRASNAGTDPGATLAQRLKAAHPLVKEVLREQIAPLQQSPDRQALENFTRFFDTLGRNFLERAPLVELFRRTFIAEQSLLILGPAGTAKSDMADQVGENVVDEAGARSYFTLQLTQDTTPSETQGGLIMDQALEGKTVRKWEEGVLGSTIVFLDEFFDGRLKFLRSFLKAFNERKYTQGRESFAGKTKVFIAASNKYINQIYEMYGNNDPQALIDRFQYIYYAPGILQETASIFALADREREDMPKLDLNEIQKLHALAKMIPISRIQILRTQYIFTNLRRELKTHEVESLKDYTKRRQRNEIVQPPYHTTRVFSPRSLTIAFKLIRVEALLRHAADPDTPLEVLDQDVESALGKFLIMQGPNTDKLQDLIEAADVDPYEQNQLHIIDLEQTAFRRIVEELKKAERTVPTSGTVAEIARALDRDGADLDLIADAEKISAKTIALLRALISIRQNPAIQTVIDRD